MGYKLSDGTDVSRMTVEQIAIAQRKLSPKFPDLATLDERRQRRRETIAARGLLFLTTGFTGTALATTDWHFYAVAAGFCFFGFVTTCFVAGNRLHIRAGGSSGRPF